LAVLTPSLDDYPPLTHISRGGEENALHPSKEMEQNEREKELTFPTGAKTQMATCERRNSTWRKGKKLSLSGMINEEEAKKERKK